MSIKLFKDIEPSSDRIYETGENHFAFYEQSSMPEIVKAKADFNEWFNHYPDKDKAKLKKDFMTENKFYDAWFELFIHELFYRQGYKLEVHPTLPESEDRTDFLAEKKRYTCYIEAKQVTGMTSEEIKLKKIKDSIIDRLQKVHLPKHMLMLQDLSFVHGASPSLKKISKWLEVVIGSIETTEIKSSSDIDHREVLRYDSDGISLEIKVLSSDFGIKLDSKETSRHRPFGVIWEGLTITDADKGALIIRNAITSKAKKYGKLDKALVLCLNLDNWSLDIRKDVEWALFSDTPDSLGYFNRTPPKHPKVSAILFTKANPSNYKDCSHRLVINPDAPLIYHFDYSELSFEMKKTKSDLYEKKSIGDIFVE